MTAHAGVSLPQRALNATAAYGYERPVGVAQNATARVAAGGSLQYT